MPGEIPITEIQKLALEPGDTLVVKYPSRMHHTMLNRLADTVYEHVQRHYPGAKVMMLDERAKLGRLTIGRRPKPPAVVTDYTPPTPEPEKPKEFFTIEEYKIWKGIDPDKPVWYGSYWCFDKWSDAQEVLDLLEKNSGGKALLRIAPSHVAKESPPTTGLGIGEYLLREFYNGSAPIRRACWPTGDHISTDSAEGGTLWYYSADEDELTKDYKLDFHDLAASDWEIIDEGTILR